MATNCTRPPLQILNGQVDSAVDVSTATRSRTRELMSDHVAKVEAHDDAVLAKLAGQLAVIKVTC